MKNVRLIALSGAALLVACSSTPPKPVDPDGSARVPANNPERVQAFQSRVAQDRQLLTQNNVLKAQVDALQQRLNEMTGIVREALLLPPAPAPVAAPAIAPARTPDIPAAQTQSSEPQPVSANRFPSLPKDAYSVNTQGVVIRVFHEFAKTDFEPSPEVARALLKETATADSVVVKGRTDSTVANPIDRLIAIERAMKARSWLLDNGVPASKIDLRYSSAGQFYANNDTEEGRALNRRVEIDITQRQAAAS